METSPASIRKTSLLSNTMEERKKSSAAAAAGIATADIAQPTTAPPTIVYQFTSPILPPTASPAGRRGSHSPPRWNPTGSRYQSSISSRTSSKSQSSSSTRTSRLNDAPISSTSIVCLERRTRANTAPGTAPGTGTGGTGTGTAGTKSLPTRTPSNCETVSTIGNSNTTQSASSRETLATTDVDVVDDDDGCRCLDSDEITAPTPARTTLDEEDVKALGVAHKGSAHNDAEIEETNDVPAPPSLLPNVSSASQKLNQGFRSMLEGLREQQKSPHKLTTSVVLLQKRTNQETKVLLDRKLNNRFGSYEDSNFFLENPSTKVPRFTPRELSLGGRLGEGEFGAVYEIESLEREKPPPHSIDESETTALECILNDHNHRNNETPGNTTAAAAAITVDVIVQGSDDPATTTTVGPTSITAANAATTTTITATRRESSHGPIGASLTLPSTADFDANNETTLDNYIRRKVDVIVQAEERKPVDIQRQSIVRGTIQPYIVDPDFTSSLPPLSSPSSLPPCCSSDDEDSTENQEQQHRSRRHQYRRKRQGIKVKDRKGEMIECSTAADKYDEWDGYVVKLVRQEIPNEKKKRIAAIDMASEAKLLSALSHPNIITVKGILGYMEGPGQYGIIMDKLRSTLQDQIENVWAKLNTEDDVPKAAPTRPRGHKIIGNVPKWLLVNKEKEKLTNLSKQNNFFLERIHAVYDVAKAMRYLHSKRIIFRDLKPENVGYTMSDDYVLFDFGLSKELKRSDQIGSTDRYRNATGLTGSCLFMAPEVARSKQYGFSADVYSFSILFWEVFALQGVFPDMTRNKHFQLVIKRGRRPSSLESVLPAEMDEMMTKSWDKNPSDRPTFDSVCETLESEIDRRTTNFNNLLHNMNKPMSMSFSEKFLFKVHSPKRNNNDDDTNDDYDVMANYYSATDDDEDNDDTKHYDDQHSMTFKDRGYYSENEQHNKNHHCRRGSRFGRRRNQQKQQSSSTKLMGAFHLNQLNSIVPESLKNIKEVSKSVMDKI